MSSRSNEDGTSAEGPTSAGPGDTGIPEWVSWGGLLVVGIVILVIFFRDQRRAEHEQAFPVLSRVEAFALEDQHGQRFDEENLRGRWWLADVMFTRCPGPCLTMIRNVNRLRETAGLEKLNYLSLSSDIEHDTPEVLRRYWQRHAGSATNWVFATGERETLYRVVIDDLKLALVEKEASEREFDEDLFIHSTLLVLIDPEGRVRATFDGGDDFDLEATLQIVRDALD